MLNAAIKEEHADGGHAYPLALVCGSSGVRCRGGSGSNCWQGCQSWAEGVHTVNMAHAQRHGHKGCEHAVMLPEHWAVVGHWWHKTINRACVHVHLVRLSFFLSYANRLRPLWCTTCGYQPFKSLLYVYVRRDWSPRPSNAYIDIIFKGKISFITTVNNQHIFFLKKG